MQMEEGLDTGPILMQQALPIGPAATAAGLDRSAGPTRRQADRRRRSTSVARGTLVAAAAAAGGRHLCAQDHPRGRPARLAAPGGGARTAGARARSRGPAPISSMRGERIRVLAAAVLADAAAASRRARCSTIAWRSPAGRACCGRCACSGRVAPRSTQPSFLRGFPIPPGNVVAVPRYKLTIEYDGAGLVGWQRQPQGLVGAGSARNRGHALLRRKGHSARRRAHRCRRPCAGAGRRISTLRARRRAEVLRGAVNHHLRPAAISVLAVEPAPEDFDARLSAIWRVYVYRILNRRAPAALERGRVWRVAPPLDVEAMREGARHLVGHHDFTTFRDRLCQAKSPLQDARRARGRPASARRSASRRGRARSCITRCAIWRAPWSWSGCGRWRPDDVGTRARRPRPPRRRPDRPGRGTLSGRGQVSQLLSRLVNDISCCTLALKSGLQTCFMFNN